MIHFVRAFLIMRADVRLIAIEEVRNYGKILYIKNIFENGWWGMHTPHPTSIDPPMVISYRYHTYFSHLAALILFFFTKRKSQRGGGAWRNVLFLNTLLHLSQGFFTSLTWPLAS